MSDSNKKKLNYSPDIEYKEDYYSDYSGGLRYNVERPSNNEVVYDQTIMDNIQNNINDLVLLIPCLPSRLQTAINQVFKPVLLDWRNDFKDRKYPIRIPDPDIPTMMPTNPPSRDPSSGGPDVGPRPGDDDSGDVPPSDITNNGGDEDDRGDDGRHKLIDEDDSYVPPFYPPGSLPEPDIDIPKTPVDPGAGTTPSIDPSIFEDIDDDLFVPAAPEKFVYDEVDPIQTIELEYNKNIADLYNHYISGLKDIVSGYFAHIFSLADYNINNDEMAFLINDITVEQSSTSQELRHLMDSALRSEVLGSIRLSFCENMFTIDSTLYHLKGMKSVYELRLRYAQTERQADSSKENSMSNRILGGMGSTYDAKYDNAYINLYKYLNSSLKVLGDVMDTISVGIKSKETIIRKGGAPAK